MSNMQQYGAAKNPPWARTATAQAIPGMQQTLLGQNSMGGMAQQGIVQYQQTQPVFQSNIMQQQTNMALSQMQQSNAGIAQGLANQLNQGQMFPQAGVVQYPAPRALNPNAFTNAQPMGHGQQGQGNPSAKQRVFTGTVTKAHNDFGFVDEDVFYQISACVKGSNPVVGDRVLVEASYNPNMPFKWYGTRIQVLPTNKSTPTRREMPKNKSFGSGGGGGSGNSGGGYNAVPPPVDTQNGNFGNNQSNRQPRDRKPLPIRREERPRQRDSLPSRQSEENDRKRKRQEREKERAQEKPNDEKEKARSPVRLSSKSRRRPRLVARYLVQIPKIALDIPEADVLEIRRRYANMYIPSDFFNTQFRWIDAFPPNAPFTMNKPCAFHIMHKDIENPITNDAVLEPPDVDYLFSAKVMLLSMPTLDELYRKCCSLTTDDKDKKDRESEERDFIHPTRLINFLVGLRGKNETMAIGGPWSPSLDGLNPDKDPSVLIKTAIRTCKAHTGIDLSQCTQWYRFVELYYRRAESVHRGKQVGARVETVVIFVPDVWSCLPTRLEWESLGTRYRRRAEGEPAGPEALSSDADQGEKTVPVDSEKKEPTHFSELDPKTMAVASLRKELWARNITNKGLKSQLIARLAKVLKQESAKDHPGDAEMEIEECEVEPEQADTSPNAVITIEDPTPDDQSKDDEESLKVVEKEKSLWKTRHALPENPHLIVHPSRAAKSGKFDCTVMTLSLLLDYRPEDSKEHSFEVSLFAELFNEMLMRDFGFNIYKALYMLPDKPKEEKDDRKKESDPKKLSDSKDKRSEEDKDKNGNNNDKDKKSDSSEKDRKDSESRKSDSKKDDRSRRDDKRDDPILIGDEENSSDKKSTSGDRKDKDRRDRQKLVTKDPHLLLSFVYFDTSHCGYIFEKDVEELLYTLGLNLSRAQVRKLVAKVVTRDSFLYRQLTDKPKDEDTEKATTDGNIAQDESKPAMKEMDLSELAAGNKRLLPVFKGDVPQSDTSELPNKRCKMEPKEAEGFVTYKGGLLDIEKLLNQLTRSEQARLDTEARLVELKAENISLQERQSKSASTLNTLTADLQDSKKKLTDTQSLLSKIAVSSKLYHTTLKEIETKIGLVTQIASTPEDDVSKTIKQESSSRWSSDESIKRENEKKDNSCDSKKNIIKKEIDD